ncbi:hypothetical protein ACQPU1_10820 [Clostridium paraputrificum]|uniref:hypothetical protein n=1 Tax=Clostridium TaxID=1485 RepID=UPI003D33538E
MIQVFCDKRGSGKTKRLIDLANAQLTKAKGDSVYIDDDSSYIRQVDRKIRFISTEDLDISDCDGFYGLLCGIISANYDIENIYIDGVCNIISCSIRETSYLFKKIYNLSRKFNFNLYMNINYEQEEVPEFIRDYVA